MSRRTIVGMALAIGLTASAPVSALAAASDAWITTKTKLALMTTEGAPATGVNVDALDGRVTLHGTVESAAEKAKAAEVARGIDGTKEVQNLLQVVPKERASAVEESDAAIKDRVVKALQADAELAGSDIEVESVNKGVVLLEGDAKTLSAHLSAVDTAAHVPGVRRVASEVKSTDALADAEIRRDAAREKNAGEKKAGDESGVRATASDMWITSATKLRLIADTEVPARDINVDTRDGVVTLFGVVPNEQAKRAAETDARKVAGVKNVKNELQVVAAAKQEAVKASDAEIERAVEQALEQRPTSSDVKVQVENGVVRLTGSVPTEQDRLQAAMAARSARGVRSVIPEDLRVETATAK